MPPGGRCSSCSRLRATRMIRLLSIQPVAERGGSDQALLRMLRSLPSGRVRVPRRGSGRTTAARRARGRRRAACTSSRWRASRRRTALRDWARYAVGWPVAVTRIARLIRRLDIDVVHTNSLHSWYGWAAAALTRRPHVWHGREIVVQSRAALRVERFLTRHFATLVICMSQAIADQLDVDPTNVVDRLRDGRPRRVLAGARRALPRARSASPTTRRSSAPPGASTRGRASTSCSTRSSVRSRRRPDAAPRRRRRPGDGQGGTLRAASRRAPRRCPARTGSAPRTDVPDLLADLDVFVLPSTEPEPYGLVVVEALASGTPVVVTDAGGPREIAAGRHPGQRPPGPAGRRRTRWPTRSWPRSPTPAPSTSRVAGGPGPPRRDARTRPVRGGVPPVRRRRAWVIAHRPPVRVTSRRRRSRNVRCHLAAAVASPRPISRFSTGPDRNPAPPSGDCRLDRPAVTIPSTCDRSGPALHAERIPTSGGSPMRHALTHHLHLGSVRDIDWVAAHFGHR